MLKRYFKLMGMSVLATILILETWLFELPDHQLTQAKAQPLKPIEYVLETGQSLVMELLKGVSLVRIEKVFEINLYIQFHNTSLQPRFLQPS